MRSRREQLIPMNRTNANVGAVMGMGFAIAAISVCGFLLAGMILLALLAVAQIFAVTLLAFLS